MIDEEQAKAVQELAKLGTQGLKTGEKLGPFLSQIIGDPIKNAAGLFYGDWLAHKRLRNLADLEQATLEYLKKRALLDKSEPVSLSIALPLLEAATDESREEIRDIWARLLANAMDPERSKTVRRDIIATVKEFEPLDALVLESIYELPERQTGWREVGSLADKLNISRQELEVSFMRLEELKCINRERAAPEAGRRETPLVYYSFFGEEVVRACKP